MDPVVKVPVEVVEIIAPVEVVGTIAPVEVVVETPSIREVVLETPLEKVVIVTGFTVSVISIQLGIQARIAVHINCCCGEEKYNEYRELTLEGEEYAAWGSDDKYILEIVQSKLSTWF